MTRKSDIEAVYSGIARYYAERVDRFGPTPFGADWDSEPGQNLRFVQLLRLCEGAPSGWSLNDLGCGYGALWAFLAWRYPEATTDYCGTDLCPAMIAAAARFCAERPGARFHLGRENPRRADYSVASGLFNVQLQQPQTAWEDFIAATLTHLAATSRLGFAVNFMRRPEDGRPVKAGLYCTRPERWMAHCERIPGTRVRVVEGYGLYEFTLLVSLPAVQGLHDAPSAPGFQ